MAVKIHVAIFFYDVAIRDRWARTMDRVQTVEEFMEKVSNEETNAEVISVTESSGGGRMTIIMRTA